ncbi:O-antigen ligase family protein [Laspinema olomoucense]|uniref:O-antigen ligase family protein n=1 Tax=Laspinema olomoucense TaxID=3231600 RepID=UPI0021BBA1E9|nr:O-antigen ligase family protein [Laspinema sp. D3c]MCT7993023.1 O-antigen ligase family protein [Laspinema sp. D3c]
MKELLLSTPINILLILFVGIVYIVVCFQLVSRYRSLGVILEKFIIGLYLFSMPGLSIAPFPTFHPTALASRDKTLPSAIVQISLYFALIFIISPTLRKTLKNSIEDIGKVVISNPFFCIFTLLITLSFAWSDTPMHTLKSTGVLIATTIVAAYIIKRYTYCELGVLLRWSLLVTAAVSTFYAQFKPAIGINNTKNSWQGIIDHPNKLAALMVLSSVLWGLEAFQNPKRRWLSVMSALLSLLVIQKAESGGARVLFIVATLCMFSVRFLKQLPFQWSFFFIVIFLILSISGFIVITENLEAIVVDGLGKDMTLTGRTPLWEYLFKEKIPLRPVLGHGFHGFWQPWRGAANPAANSLSGKLFMPSGAGYWSPPHAHNGFIEIILDFGYLGLFCFIMGLIKTLADAVRYLINPPAKSQMIESVLPLLLLILIVFPNLTESPLLENNHIWYYYVFVSVGLSIKTEQKTVVKKVTKSHKALI